MGKRQRVACLPLSVSSRVSCKCEGGERVAFAPVAVLALSFGVRTTALARVCLDFIVVGGIPRAILPVAGAGVARLDFEMVVVHTRIAHHDESERCAEGPSAVDSSIEGDHRKPE